MGDSIPKDCIGTENPVIHPEHLHLSTAVASAVAGSMLRLLMYLRTYAMQKVLFTMHRPAIGLLHGRAEQALCVWIFECWNCGTDRRTENPNIGTYRYRVVHIYHIGQVIATSHDLIPKGT